MDFFTFSSVVAVFKVLGRGGRKRDATLRCRIRERTRKDRTITRESCGVFNHFVAVSKDPGFWAPEVSHQMNSQRQEVLSDFANMDVVD